MVRRRAGRIVFQMTFVVAASVVQAQQTLDCGTTFSHALQAGGQFANGQRTTHGPVMI